MAGSIVERVLGGVGGPGSRVITRMLRPRPGPIAAGEGALPRLTYRFLEDACVPDTGQSGSRVTAGRRPSTAGRPGVRGSRVPEPAPLLPYMMDSPCDTCTTRVNNALALYTRTSEPGERRGRRREAAENGTSSSGSFKNSR